jgi:hypothetical protein
MALQELQLVLACASDAEPARFSVFAAEELAFPWGRARLHVIGASSLVVVEAPGVSLAEVIACAWEGAAAAPVAAARLPAGKGACASVACADAAFEYRARLWVGRPGEAPFPRPLPHSLAYRFPGPTAPLTRIEAEETPGGLLLRTRHDYPEAHAVVWSESEWRFTGCGR